MAGMQAFDRAGIKRLLDDLLTTGGALLLWCCLAAVLFAVGGRISEVLTLRRGDLLDENGELRDTVRRLKLKARKKTYITVKINREMLQRYIMPWLEYQRREYGKIHDEDYVFADGWKREPLHRIAVYRGFTRTYRRLKIDDQRHGTHGFRKTFARLDLDYWVKCYNGDWLKAARQVQKHLGHAQLETTLKYLGLDGDNPDESINVIFDFLA